MHKFDFKKTGISELFFRMFIPTLLGMVSTTTLVVFDGIFVGRGVGSDALAGINLAMPLFMIVMGIGLMFGVGASVIAAIHLSNGRIEDANLSLTQSLTVSLLFVAFLSSLVMIFDERVAALLGGSEKLIPLALEYIHIFISFAFLQVLLIVGQFIIRLDGSPNYAMMCNVVPAIINIILDYVFIFIFGWGLSGAAWASVVGMISGATIFLMYMLYYSKTLRFKFGGFARSNLHCIVKNTTNASKIGFSGLLSELAMASMFLMGNNVFIRTLGEDGVAAFSVICYLFPVIFMVASAIVQSAQPIISFNFGNREYKRISKVLCLSLLVSSVFSICASFFIIIFGRHVVSLFLPEIAKAHEIAVYGIHYFAAGFIFFALNMVLIGYSQSIDHASPATVFTVLRGVFMAACFIVLPILFGVKGVWMAMPIAELLTFLMISLYMYHGRDEQGLLSLPCQVKEGGKSSYIKRQGV